jgi:hypothetical protein
MLRKRSPMSRKRKIPPGTGVRGRGFADDLLNVSAVKNRFAQMDPTEESFGAAERVTTAPRGA